MVNAELVQKAQRASGDEAIEAYREVVHQHQALMYRAAYLASGSQGAAEHITEDAFVNAFADLDDLADPNQFRPWMLKYVTDEALNFRHMTDQVPSLTIQPGNTNSRQKVVVEAMNHVSDFDRILLSYHFTLRLPDAEIASALAIPGESYAGRLAEAQRSLNRQIANLSAGNAAEPPPASRAAPDADTIETPAVSTSASTAQPASDESEAPENAANSSDDRDEPTSEGASS